MSNLLDKASIILTPTAYNNGEALCVKPSDGSGDFDFSRNSAATRVNAQGLVENVQILSSNLVQNGDFSEEGAEEVSNGSFTNGSNDWQVEGNSSIVVGDFKGKTDVAKININNTSTGSRIRQTFNYVSGKTYKVDVEVYVESGNFRADSSDSFVVGDFVSTSTLGSWQTLTANITAISTGSNYIWLRSISGVSEFYVSNVSVKEVGIDWTLDDWSVGNSLVSSGNTSSLLRQDNIYTSTTSIYKTTFKAKSVNGTSVTLRVYDGSGNNFETITITSSEFQDFTLTRQRQGASPSLFFYNNSNAEIEITNISVIEISSDTNLPRINYEGFSFDGSGNIVPNSGCGSWLFENQSTNLIPQSELFSDASWSKVGNSTLGANAGTSPSGSVDAYSLIPEILDERHVMRHTFTATSLDVTGSLFVKPNGYNHISVSMIYSANSAGAGVIVDLTDGSVYASRAQSGASFSVKVDDYADGWKRVSLSVTQSANALDRFAFGAFDGGAVVWNAGLICPVFAGNGTDGVLIYGAQVEEQSYATSYIPTSGSSVTRNQDVCTNGGSLATINSTEGTLYFEGSALADNTGTFRSIALSDGTTDNRVIISYTDATNTIRVLVFRNNSLQVIMDRTINATDTNKLAISYKSNEVEIWINGVKEGTDTNAFMPIGLNELSFSRGDGDLPFFGKTKCLAVFPYLTDAELTELTTI